MFLATTVYAQGAACGDPFNNGSNGPFDYRTSRAHLARVVEPHHFTTNVELMRGGASTNVIGSDIAYTLRVSPNHHRALTTMGQWSLRTKSNPPKGSVYTVECWFDRAIRFRADDAMVKVIYGNYLIKSGKAEKAIAQFQAAIGDAGEDANVYYNLGLAYIELKKYDLALENAHMAYRLGFPLPGLKNRLQRAGAWREAPVGSAEIPQMRE
ncbi:MAG: hypothetical protein Q7J47_12990 [Azoarcus sp.]|nr:hypothetical protein [Azoarcus sp.]